MVSEATSSRPRPGEGRMPALFLGHGNPMNALERNRFSEAWWRLGAALPRPSAILSISAHWYLPGTRVTDQQRPPTIHDFGGFPTALYEVTYPAPGSPELAARVVELLGSDTAAADGEWGLDHGTWSVLVHLFPDASVPVVQLSIDRDLAPLEHVALAARLRPLRREGVMILGSGNLVHNLGLYDWDDREAAPQEWAARFESYVRGLIEQGDLDGVAMAGSHGTDGPLSVPTPDHFLPLLYVLAQNEGEPVSFPVEGFEGGSISMLGVLVG